MQGLVTNRDSVSKYCLQRSPVPTIVVRPSNKRTKKKLKRKQEAGRSVYANILTKAQTVGGRHVMSSAHNMDGFEKRGGEAEADAVEKAVGPRRKGILRNKEAYGGPLARVTSTAEDEEDDPNNRFALPIGFLTTESAPRADLAMKSPIIQALVEWDDSPVNGSRANSPGPDSALTDGETDDEGPAKLLDHRRPSTRSTVGWLNNILSKPEAAPAGRPVSRERGHDRSRSR